MSFPQDVIDAAWQRALGACECTLKKCGHWYRCSKVLDPRNEVENQKWHAHHITSQKAGGPDTLNNCQILCVPCHQNTDSYGG